MQQAITKGHYRVDFREHTNIFVLECARYLEHYLNVEGVAFAEVVSTDFLTESIGWYEE